MYGNNKNIIVRKSIEFVLSFIEYGEILEKERKFVIPKQLLKSGTSIDANIKEAQSAESITDFIHKLSIWDKNAGETEYWILLCKFFKSFPVHSSLNINLIERKNYYHQSCLNTNQF